MADPFLSEIKIISFHFAPRGWAFCNGQLLPIAQNTALFSLLGTMYGGNGQTTFGLPNLQGRTPIHVGSAITQGEAGGEQAHTLTAAEVQHQHRLMASMNQAAATTPANNVLAAKKRGGKDVYQASGGAALSPQAIGTSVGSGQPHDNMQPYSVVNFVIALVGVFPSRT